MILQSIGFNCYTSTADTNKTINKILFLLCDHKNLSSIIWRGPWLIPDPQDNENFLDMHQDHHNFHLNHK